MERAKNRFFDKIADKLPNLNEPVCTEISDILVGHFEILVPTIGTCMHVFSNMMPNALA